MLVRPTDDRGKVIKEQQVLEEGLLSTLYRVGPRNGPFSMFNLQSQSAGSGFNQQAQSASQEGSNTDDEQTIADGSLDGPGNLPSDIFKQLADEMDKLLMQRSVAQELAANPPTARKVLMRRGPDSVQQPVGASGTAMTSSAAERLVQAVSEVFKRSAEDDVRDVPEDMQA